MFQSLRIKTWTLNTILKVNPVKSQSKNPKRCVLAIYKKWENIGFQGRRVELVGSPAGGAK